MIFYGKASRGAAPAAALGEVAGFVAEATAAALPIARHAAWASALVEAGGLAQGLADAEEEAAKVDGEDPEAPGRAAALAMALCLALAAVVGRSWDSAFADLPAAVPPRVAEALAALGEADRKSVV